MTPATLPVGPTASAAPTARSSRPAKFSGKPQGDCRFVIDGYRLDMGIGLAIAHGLAQVIGATITVTSELNKGSSFTVTAPSPSDGITPRT